MIKVGTRHGGGRRDGGVGSAAAAGCGAVAGGLVRTEGIGDLPEVLAPEEGWQPRAEERALDEWVRTECTTLGWLDSRGRLDVDVASALRVVCSPSVEVSGWITDGSATVGVLAGAIGRAGVLAVSVDGWATLRSVRSENLVRSVVAQTPDVEAGQGQSVTVRRSDVLAAIEGARSRAHGGMAVRPVAVEVRQWQQWAALPRIGGGEFRISIRDGVGRSRVTPSPVCYVDTTVGRYVTLCSVVADDVEMFVTPAGPHDLVARLQAAHRSLAN